MRRIGSTSRQQENILVPGEEAKGLVLGLRVDGSDGTFLVKNHFSLRF
jgi:hypothetical protein